VYRFWLYLAIPLVILAALGTVRAVRLAATRSRLLAVLLEPSPESVVFGEPADKRSAGLFSRKLRNPP
jgi:hypothetical protein